MVENASVSQDPREMGEILVMQISLLPLNLSSAATASKVTLQFVMDTKAIIFGSDAKQNKMARKPMKSGEPEL